MRSQIILLTSILIFSVVNLLLTIKEIILYFHAKFSCGEHSGRILGESGPEEEGTGGVTSSVTPEEYNKLLEELNNFEMIIEKGRYLYNEESRNQ